MGVQVKGMVFVFLVKTKTGPERLRPTVKMDNHTSRAL